MTDTATDAGLLARPQPIGVFPLPAGYLLIPSGAPTAAGDRAGGDGDALDAVRRDLVAGKLPASFPPALRFYERALAGDLDAALAELTGDDLVTRANRLVLDPTPDAWRSLAADVALAGDLGLAGYVATVGYVVGLADQPPSVDGLDGELAAFVNAARATRDIEAGDLAAAVEELEAAALAANTVSAPLAGQLMGQLANVQLDEGGVQRASVTFQAALDALAGTDLAETRAELHVAAGAMFQEMSEAAPRLMQRAIDHYHQAMALVTAETAPETFAIANANLGLAYLTMPMQEASDQLRMAVAVQSMREALTVFTPESHPDRWSSTQLNLANALVYLPSKHQADNIAEAVQLYEEVLAHRDRNTDPQGRARVLANQGNALAHLGLFDDAKGKLHEARSLFEEFEEHEAVRSVRGVLDEIAKHESIARQDSGS